MAFSKYNMKKYSKKGEPFIITSVRLKRFLWSVKRRHESSKPLGVLRSKRGFRMNRGRHKVDVPGRLLPALQDAGAPFFSRWFLMTGPPTPTPRKSLSFQVETWGPGRAWAPGECASRWPTEHTSAPAPPGGWCIFRTESRQNRACGRD